MKRIASVVLAAAAGCATPHADDPVYRPATLTAVSGARDEKRDGPLSLEACVREALSQSRAIRSADRRVLIASDRGDEMLAMLLPRVSAQGRFEARNNDPGAIFNGVGVIAGERRAATGSVNVLVPIYDFGVSYNRLRAAHLEEDRAEHDAEDARLRTEMETSLAYFRVLEARGVLRVVEESLNAVERQVAAAKEARAAGLAAANDVIAAEAQEAERRQQLLSARNNVRIAEAVLNRFLGRDLRAAVEIEDVEDAPAHATPYEGDLAAALDRRPDLAALRTDIEVSQARWRATRDSFFPRIYAFGSWNGTTDDFVLHKSWLSGGVGIDIPLFDGGSTIAGVRRAGREIEQAVDRNAEGVDDAALSVMKAWLDVDEAQARIPVARKAVELAQENMRVTRDMYAQGISTSTDVLLEEDRLARAQSGALQARYAVHAAQARLRYETGSSITEKRE